MDETLRCVESLIESGGAHLVATADASGLALAQDDPELLEVYRGATVVTPDSQGVVWALKRAGHVVEGRVSGVDLLDRICGLSSEKGYRLYFLGAEPGVAELAAERLRLRHPGCNIVGARHGYFPPSDDDVVAEEVASHHPDVLFVAMGIPRQEKFIAKTMRRIQAKVAIGVGGSLDVFSGRVRRAPHWVQSLKLEWLWRTLLNPKKLSKAKLLPRFVWLTLRSGK
jgi:N-acetylglucosaminyldiphosphoundecaprenol N-acetyl-beta-D-mannosaminyltransferase